MATYKVFDLLDVLSKIANEGYFYIDVNELDGDEDFPAALGFDVIIDSSSSEDYEEVESISIPKDYIYGYAPLKFKPDDVSKRLTFTLSELVAITNALDISLEAGKERLVASDCTRDERDDIKALAIDFRNLQAKLNKFYKNYGIKLVNASRN